ncbi:MAG TPA: hypothetical protein DD687_13065 [Verrucomicrobiales bacterium]|nr:hypothetical protein [Verrucomicrobiales bacterium]
MFILINQLPIDPWDDVGFWRVLDTVEFRSKTIAYNRKGFSMPASNCHARYSSDFYLRVGHRTKSANSDSL